MSSQPAASPTCQTTSAYEPSRRTSSFSTPQSQPRDRRPLVVSGPSGVGKSSLCKRLTQEQPRAFGLSVSHTTRPPRPGERDGVEYHFVTAAEFDDLVTRGAFVEHAVFNGNRYGTSRQALAEQAARGRVAVLDIELEGLRQIKRSGVLARYVFIAPPSEEELERRLRGRGTETEESVLGRLARAKVELEFARTPGVHDKIIVNNGEDAAYRELEDFANAPVKAI